MPKVFSHARALERKLEAHAPKFAADTVTEVFDTPWVRESIDSMSQERLRTDALHLFESTHVPLGAIVSAEKRLHIERDEAKNRTYVVDGRGKRVRCLEYMDPAPIERLDMALRTGGTDVETVLNEKVDAFAAHKTRIGKVNSAPEHLKLTLGTMTPEQFVEAADLRRAKLRGAIGSIRAQTFDAATVRFWHDYVTAMTKSITTKADALTDAVAEQDVDALERTCANPRVVAQWDNDAPGVRRSKLGLQRQDEIEWAPRRVERDTETTRVQQNQRDQVVSLRRQLARLPKSIADRIPGPLTAFTEAAARYEAAFDSAEAVYPGLRALAVAADRELALSMMRAHLRMAEDQLNPEGLLARAIEQIIVRGACATAATASAIEPISRAHMAYLARADGVDPSDAERKALDQRAIAQARTKKDLTAWLLRASQLAKYLQRIGAGETGTLPDDVKRLRGDERPLGLLCLLLADPITHALRYRTAADRRFVRRAEAAYRAVPQLAQAIDERFGMRVSKLATTL